MAFITISTNQPILPKQQTEIVQAFGNATHTGYPELTAQISHILHRTLGIASGRVFVEFCDITAFGVGDFYVER